MHEDRCGRVRYDADPHRTLETRGDSMDELRALPSIGRCRFGVFDFDGTTLELSKNGRLVPVRPQPLKLLALLLARPGELISRDDLQRALWDGDTFVDFEQGVNHAIRELRAALGDDAESPRFIQTLPRRGYRFIGPVDRVSTPEVARQPSAEITERSPAVDTASVPVLAAPRATGSRPLRQTWAAGGVVAIIAGVATETRLRPGESTNPYAPSALIVRPFAAPADPPLGVGLARHLIEDGEDSRWCLSGRTARAMRDSGDHAAATWPQNATHALDGEISISGTEVAVQARLEDVGRRAIVWSERFHVRSDELFSLEDVIAERVVAALRLRLAATEQDRIRRRYTSNAAAYREYVRGRAHASGTRPRARCWPRPQAFEGALQLDPGYALARAGLAMACADMYLAVFAAGRSRALGRAGGSGGARRTGSRIRTSPRHTSPGRRWRASASSTGKPRSRRSAGPWRSIRIWIRPASSSRAPTITTATWRKRSPKWRRADAFTAPM